MSCGSSPGVYLRCSLNSTEKPWKGLACRPCRNPLTINCARKSKREICRMTSGFRYFSTVDMLRIVNVDCSTQRGGDKERGRRETHDDHSPTLPGSYSPPGTSSRELWYLRHGDFREQAGDEIFGGQSLGLGLKIGADTVP